MNSKEMKNKLIPDLFDSGLNKREINYEIDIHNLTSCYTSTENLLDNMLTFKSQKLSKNESFTINCNIFNTMNEPNNNAVDLKSLPLDKVLICLKHRGSSYIISTDQFIKAIEYFDLTSRQERLIKQDNAQRLSTDSALFQSYLQNSDKPFLAKNISVNQKRMEDEVVKIICMLEEKEKDLELAAKIGKSLLEQNQELKERNLFLHDSLTKNADTINELKHQVKYKEKLIRSIKKDDDIEVIEHEKNVNSSIDFLKNKVDGLKKKNCFLKNEAIELRTLNKNFEEEKKLLVEHYTRNLDKTNSQISKLQCIINEKDQECFSQTKEIEKLIREIFELKNQEKSFIEENTFLTEKLGEMVVNHEHLKEEIFAIQDKYTEVSEKLKEAEEELSRFRKKPSVFQRTMSSDSLYDSLASEIEIHDSGFYTTPMVSARSDSRGSNCLSSHRDEENNKSKYYSIEESLSYELAAIGCDNILQNISSTTCTTQLNQNVDDTLTMFSSIYDNDNYLKKENIKTNKDNIEHPNDPTSNISTPLVEDDTHLLMSSTPIKRIVTNERILETKDVSCSPIQEFLDNCYNRSNQSTPHAVNQNLHYSHYDSDSENDMIVVKPKCQLINHNDSINSLNNYTVAGTTNSLKLSKTYSSSNDSLSDYTPLKIGVPGKLGTRDLEFCIRKVEIRKKIEKDYEEYRASNGLAPSKYPMFQNNDSVQTKGVWPYAMDLIKGKFNFLVGKTNCKQDQTRQHHSHNTSCNINSNTSYNNYSKKIRTIADIGINTLTFDDNNKKILNGVVSRNNINYTNTKSKSLTSTPIKMSSSRNVSKVLNTLSFSSPPSQSSRTHLQFLQTSSSRCSSPILTSITTGHLQPEPSIDDILSETESQQKISGVINRIDIVSEKKNS